MSFLCGRNSSLTLLRSLHFQTSKLAHGLRSKKFADILTHQDIFEQWQTLAPLDQFKKTLVRHIGKCLYHILFRRDGFFESKFNVFFVRRSR